MVRCCQGQFWSNIQTMSDPTFHQFKLRLPTELFKRLEEEAGSSSRSVSAEIIHRLEGSFAPSPIETMTVAEVIEEAVQKSIAEAEKRIAHINRSLLMAEYAKAGITVPDLDVPATNEDYPTRSARQQLLDARDHEIEVLVETVQELMRQANGIGPDDPEYQPIMAKVAELRALEAELRESADSLHRGLAKATPGTSRKSKK